MAPQPKTRSRAAADHAARSEAARANQRLDAHEAHCAERWEQSRAQAAELKRAVDALSGAVADAVARIWGRLWWAVGLILGAEAAVILFLADRVLS